MDATVNYNISFDSNLRMWIDLLGIQSNKKKAKLCNDKAAGRLLGMIEEQNDLMSDLQVEIDGIEVTDIDEKFKKLLLNSNIVHIKRKEFNTELTLS